MDETLPLFNIAPPIDAIQHDHALWLETGGKAGRRAHFHKSDLTGLDLSRSAFSEGSMRGIIIRNVNFAGAELTGCDFSDSLIENVDFRGAVLSGASFIGSRLHNVQFDAADINGADFLNVLGARVTFIGARMEAINLRNADLQQADFTLAYLAAATLREGIFTDSLFNEADLTEADCRDANFDKASFARAVVTNANFKHASLSAINVQDADFAAALDVTFDIQTQMLFEEKRNLQHERIVLEEMGKRLSSEQKIHDAREEAIHLRERKFDAAVNHMKWVVRAFKGISALWVCVSIILLTLTLSRISQITSGSVNGILAGVGMVLILTFLSLYFALKTRYILINLANRLQKTAKK